MIRVTYTISRSDLTSALASRRRFWSMSILVALIIFAALTFSRHSVANLGELFDRPVQQIVSPMFGSLCAGLAYSLLQRFIFLPRKLARLYRDNPALFLETELVVDTEGFRTASLHSTAPWKWAEVMGYSENAKVFVLRPTHAIGYVVPKRALSTAESRELRTLLAEKLA